MNSRNYEIIDTRVIYLTSASRVNLSDPIHNCSYILDPYVFSVQSDEYLEIQLSSFVVKYSFYNIDTDRNAQAFVSTSGGAGFSLLQSLPTGNYSTKELAKNIQTLLRAVTADTITVEWNKNKNKYKYTVGTVPLNNIVLKFPEGETGYEIYGFTKGDTTLNGDGTRQFNLGTGIDADGFSPAIVSIGNEESLYINADFSISKNYQLLENKQVANSIYGKVHIIAPFYAFIYYVGNEYNLFTNHYPPGVSPKNEFRINITDEVGNPIKLQSEYQLTLRVIKRKYVKEETNTLLQNLIKLQATNLLKKK